MISCQAYYRKGQPFYKSVFNVCALPLSVWIASHLFFVLAGIDPLGLSSPEPSQTLPIKEIFLPLLAFTVVYFSLNSGIIALAISLEKQLSPIRIWRDNFVWLSLNYFGGASVAFLLVTYTRNIDLTYLAVIIPLLFILYFTFSTSMGRVEDANRHLTQLNALYMSTIETLAMAIDAKDQITHGHIRRVQTYAVGLAKQVGVSDESVLRAVEAAALLHDMGKLAVPELHSRQTGFLDCSRVRKNEAARQCWGRYPRRSIFRIRLFQSLGTITKTGMFTGTPTVWLAPLFRSERASFQLSTALML